MQWHEILSSGIVSRHYTVWAESWLCTTGPNEKQICILLLDGAHVFKKHVVSAAWSIRARTNVLFIK